MIKHAMRYAPRKPVHRAARSCSVAVLLILPFCVRAQTPTASPSAPPGQAESAAIAHEAETDPAKLKEENERLRKENQRLRRLLGEQPAQQSRRSDKAAQASSPAAAGEQQQGTGYWLSENSGKRHNSKCRNFQKTNGRFCAPDEGEPCGLCGG